MLPVRDSPEGARFLVRVTPRASRTAILGAIGEGSVYLERHGYG